MIKPHGSCGNKMAQSRMCALCNLVFPAGWSAVCVCTRSEQHGSKHLCPLFPLSCQSARRHSAPGSAGLSDNSSTLTRSTDLSPQAQTEATQLLTFPGLCMQTPMMPCYCCYTTSNNPAISCLLIALFYTCFISRNMLWQTTLLFRGLDFPALLCGRYLVPCSFWVSCNITP